ncbi:hypothetical protein BD413DRAFT_210777 [Trametes elegans]|nr:hypothetical protein BD413DRAFT_210777 [Trametes elegans]
MYRLHRPLPRIYRSDRTAPIPQVDARQHPQAKAANPRVMTTHCYKTGTSFLMEALSPPAKHSVRCTSPDEWRTVSSFGVDRGRILGSFGIRASSGILSCVQSQPCQGSGRIALTLSHGDTRSCSYQCINLTCKRQLPSMQVAGDMPHIKMQQKLCTNPSTPNGLLSVHPPLHAPLSPLPTSRSDSKPSQAIMINVRLH